MPRRVLSLAVLCAGLLVGLACSSSHAPDVVPASTDDGSRTAADVLNRTLAAFIDHASRVRNVTVEAETFTSYYRRTYATPVPQLDVQSVPDTRPDRDVWASTDPWGVVVEPLLASRLDPNVDLVASVRRDTLGSRPLHVLTMHVIHDGAKADGTDRTETRRVWIDPAVGMPRQMQRVADDGTVAVTVRWSDFSLTDGWLWPRRISVSGLPDVAGAHVVRVTGVHVDAGVPTTLFPPDPHTASLNDTPPPQADSLAFVRLQRAVRAHQARVRDVDSYTTWSTSFAADHQYSVRRDLRLTELELKSWDTTLPKRVQRLGGIDWTDMGDLFQFSAAAFVSQDDTTLYDRPVHRLHADAIYPYGMPGYGAFLRDLTIWLDAERHLPRRVERTVRYPLAGPQHVWIRETINLPRYRTVDGLVVPDSMSAQLSLPERTTKDGLLATVADDEDWIAEQPAGVREQLTRETESLHTLLRFLATYSEAGFLIPIQDVHVRPRAPSDTTFVDDTRR